MSEIPLARLASGLEQTVGDPTRFDIRWLGAIHGLIFLVFYYSVLTLLRPLSGIARFTLSLLALWIFADIGLLAYFNSFYSDVPAALGGLATAMLAANLLASRRPAPWTLVLFGLAALLFITSKAQHGVYGPIPAALALLLAWRASEKRTRATGFVVAVTLLLATAWILSSTPDWYKALTRFDLIFFKIAKNSPTPVQDLRELGLGPEDARYIGQHGFIPGGPMQTSWAETFRVRTSTGRILTFYLRHSSRALAILRSDLDELAWQRRAPALGNFQRPSGRAEGATAMSLGSWSALRTWLSRVWPPQIAIWLLLFPAAALWLAAPFVRRVATEDAASRWQRALAWTMLAVSLMAAGEFAIASLTDAIETSRHLLMFHLFTDVSIFLGLVFAASVVEASCRNAFRRPALAVATAGLVVFVVSIVNWEVAAAAPTAKPDWDSSELAIAVDDANPAVAYSGHWSSGAFRSAFRGTLTYSDEPGAIARFSFEGTEFQYIYTKAPNRGMALVSIDGISQTIDLYDPQPVWQVRTVFGGLKPGPHVAEVRVLGRRNSASSGNFIDIDALVGR